MLRIEMFNESPKVWMAMTTPGMGFLSGTAS
jgi:hypothetical protein